MISETAGAMERSKAAIICWSSLQVWLKIMQLLSYNSLSCKPINIPISPLAAMHFFCFAFFFQNSSKYIFSLAGAEDVLTCTISCSYCSKHKSLQGKLIGFLCHCPFWDQRAWCKATEVRKVSWVNCHYRVNEHREQPLCVKKFLFVLWICNVST